MSRPRIARSHGVGPQRNSDIGGCDQCFRNDFEAVNFGGSKSVGGWKHRPPFLLVGPQHPSRRRGRTGRCHDALVVLFGATSCIASSRRTVARRRAIVRVLGRHLLGVQPPRRGTTVRRCPGSPARARWDSKHRSVCDWRCAM